MTKTIFFAVTVATVFAISMMLTPALGGGHLFLDKANVKVNNGELDVKIKATANIPQDGQSAFGYAVLTDGTNKVLVLVTHLPAFDDSAFDQPPDGFHTHVLNLIPSTPACQAALPGSQFEVDTTAAITDPGYKFKVNGPNGSIKDVPLADLDGDGSVDLIAAFAAGIVGPVGAPTNVCVKVTDTIP